MISAIFYLSAIIGFLLSIIMKFNGESSFEVGNTALLFLILARVMED